MSIQMKNNARAGKVSETEPRSSYHHGDLRNALIAAGRNLLEEIGPRDLSLREAARRVGVSIAAPSRHFDGKEALLAAIAASGFHELAAERQAVLSESRGSLENVKQMLIQYVAFARRHVGLFNLMVGPMIIQRNAYPELITASNDSFELFARSVTTFAREHGWPENSMNLLIHSAWSIEHGVAMLIIGGRIPRKERPVEIDEMIDFCVAMLISAIVAGPDGLKAANKSRAASAATREARARRVANAAR